MSSKRTPVAPAKKTAAKFAAAEQAKSVPTPVPQWIKAAARSHVADADLDAAILGLFTDANDHATGKSPYPSALELVVGAYFRLWARTR